MATAAAVFDLSAFDDSKVIIRFQFGTDSFEGGDGANFDNIFVEGTRLPDTDGDGMHDGYESAHGLNPTVDDRLLDLDGDGIDNITEYAHCTDPDNRDTDGDGLDDNVETNTGTYTSPTDTGTDPRYADTDEDTLRDREEVTVYGTDPNKKDTDGDGFDDNIEIELGYDPTNSASKPPLPIVIGYWSFDDEANPTADLSAAGNDGAVNGGASFVPGQSGEPGDLAISFDGLDDSVTTTASLLNGLTKFTMSGWVRFEATQPNRTGFFGQNDCVEFGMIDATNMQHWLAGSGGALNAPFGPAPEWTHLLITCDATSRTIYVDGEAVASGTGTSAPSSAFTFNIGGGGIYDELATNGNFFNGEIDDVAVWDQVLTVEQIALLASRELTPLGPPNRAQLKIIAIDHAPDADTTELTWESTEGELFEIRKSTTLTGIPVAWPIVLGQVPAAAAPADATTAVVDTNATEPQAFYKIFKIPPPPLFEDDFETDQGWITGANPGDAGTTVWERGVPANVGPFTGASGSANAFGTNLAADYEAGADIYLRSPVIDLTGPGIANVRLKFQQYFDTDLFSDFGFIRVLRASDNVPLGATIDLLFETFTVDWESFTTDLPPEAIGEMIRLEFQFTSDATDTNFSGWYIDDVVVTRR